MQIPKDIQKKDIYREFVEWMGLPAPLRKPQYQKDFASEKGIDKATLSRWKYRDEFWDEVRTERQKWLKDKVSTALYSMYNKILKTGNAPEVKLFLEAADEFENVVSIKTEKEWTDEDEQKVINVLKNEGLLKKDNTEQETKEDSS